MLNINNLKVVTNDKIILNDFNIKINSGEVHAIMGPNGAGKSTLSKVIMGSNDYEVISGNIEFAGNCINDLSTDERAKLGLFLSFQNPLSVDGVTNSEFLRTAINSINDKPIGLYDFIKSLDKATNELSMPSDMIHKTINKGASGGERKKNEILQMYMLKPSFVILDELDSGLDVDSLKTVATNVMDYYNEHKPLMMVITHYQRLLDYIKPDYVHIIKNGRIIKSGDSSLVKEIENNGYDNISSEFVIEENY